MLPIHKLIVNGLEAQKKFKGWTYFQTCTLDSFFFLSVGIEDMYWEVYNRSRIIFNQFSYTVLVGSLKCIKQWEKLKMCWDTVPMVLLVQFLKQDRDFISYYTWIRLCILHIKNKGYASLCYRFACKLVIQSITVQ